MIDVIHHPREQQALAHIISEHNPFYRPSLFDSWYFQTPVEELAHMRSFHDPMMAPPSRVLEACTHPHDSIYPPLSQEESPS